MFAPRCIHPLHLLHPHDKLRVITVPCGQCIACRIRKASHWASRALMEYHTSGCGVFLTLTYDDASCPDYLDKRHLQLFFKRFRHSVGQFRYLACGEYGEQSCRPHYHALLFGLDLEHPIFSLFRPVGTGRAGHLADWPYGLCHVGSITEQSALYLCKYTVKQVPNEVCDAVQPFLVMSRRPGLGHAYIMRYADRIRSGRDPCIRYTGDGQPSLSRYVKKTLDDVDMMTDFDLTPVRLARRHEIEQYIATAHHEFEVARACPHGVDVLTFERSQNRQRGYNLEKS